MNHEVSENLVKHLALLQRAVIALDGLNNSNHVVDLKTFQIVLCYISENFQNILARAVTDGYSRVVPVGDNESTEIHSASMEGKQQ